MDWIVGSFKFSTASTSSGDKMAMQRIKEAAEKAKIELSGMTSASINLPFITADATGPKHLDLTLSRAKFNELTADLVEQTMGPVRQALSDSGLSINEINKVLMVGGSSRIPAVQEAVKKLIGKEPFKGINPDECVAIGAALQAGVLGGEVQGLLLLDVTPLSLGVETMGGVMTKIIERKRRSRRRRARSSPRRPTARRRLRSTCCRASASLPATTSSLGLFKLDGIAPAPRGIPQIEVTFDIDANGIVNVSAKDLGTGKEQHITISSSSNMSKEDIDKAVKAAEQFAEEDKKRREEVEMKNNAENMCYSADKLISDNGDKLDEADKNELNSKSAALRSAIQSGTTETIKSRHGRSQKAMYAVSEKLYKGVPHAGSAAAVRRCAGRRPAGRLASRAARTAMSTTQTTRTSSNSDNDPKRKGVCVKAYPLPFWSLRGDDSGWRTKKEIITRCSVCRRALRTTRSRRHTASSRSSTTRLKPRRQGGRDEV